MKKDFGKIQLIIGIVAALYIFMPDLFVGPVDDSVVFMLTVIAEVIMGVIKASSKDDPERLEVVGDFDDSALE